MKLVTATQMREIEKSSVEAGVSLDQLMENAGLAVAEAVRDEFGEHSELFGKRITTLIGAGNNGADGFVASRHLAKWGANVTAVLCTKRKSPDPKQDSALEAGVSVVDGVNDSSAEILRTLLESTDLIIDAILGIGSSRPIADPLSAITFAALESGVTVIALDLPTGINSDTGEFDVAGLPADRTLMLGYPKLGPAIAADPSVTGEVSVVDIGVPEGLDSQVDAELITEQLATSFLPERPFGGHKGTFGSALIIGGSKDYLGAVTMATDAATRSGVGLTFVATPAPAYRQIAGDIREAMYRALPVNADNNLQASEAAKSVLDLAAKSTSVTIGPGLGTSSAARKFVSTVLSEIDPNTPLVLDADALNILSGSHLWWERFTNPSVLTPHPGEMGRLMGMTSNEVQNNRLQIAQEAASKFNKVVVLKGASTLIADPDGRIAVSPWINTGLAKGGSGDVLAGLLGGIVAQQPDQLFEMAALAVYIHAYAAEAARQDLGETGMRATDVIERLGLFYRDAIQLDFN
ncbi:MAG: NAD(P)H-hydrate dehydratase [Chloroflexi bacterium]|jgi:ADP-dependent NAD(P)H-hydrate dehydratase / NAD(P)H-hydrate epimerase|nr:NAD(P)H-hydrate dehydratase [Chloroflexota bacterium]